MSETTKTKSPQGVVAVLIAPDGHVVAHGADFDRSGYGGFTMLQAQTMRAEQMVKREAIRAMCNAAFAKAACEYSGSGPRIIDDMCRAHGYRIEIIRIGYEGDDDDA